MDRPLHPDDIVALKSDPTQLASVERTPDSLEYNVPLSHREEQLAQISRGPGVDAATLRRLKTTGVPAKGTVLVRWENETLQLLKSDTVDLVVRSLLTGDIVKRNVSDAQSGTVLSTYTTCVLQPLCDVTHRDGGVYKGLLPPSNTNLDRINNAFVVRPDGQPPLIHGVPACELSYSDPISDLTTGDLVIYRSWVGRVRDKADIVCVRLLDGCVVEIRGDDAEHVDGVLDAFAVGDVLQTKKGTLRNGNWIFGRYNANTRPIGTVVNVRARYLEVEWLQKRIGSTEAEPPHALEDSEWESSDFFVFDRNRRPLKPLSHPGVTEQTLSNSELDLQLHQRVRFRDLSAACSKYNTPDKPNAVPRHDRKDNMGYDLNVFDVITFRTEITVQWQDLSIGTYDSADLVPDSGIDDSHAAWPGEISHSLSMRQVAGSEDLESPDRVGVVQSVNAAERMARISWNADSSIEYARGQEGDANVGSIVRYHIATSPGIIEEVSLYDVDTPGPLNVRRGDVVLIDRADYNPRTTEPQDRTWLGEIVDTPLDGSLVIRLCAAAEVVDVVLKRHEVIVAVRSDGTDEMGEEEWEDEVMDSEMEELMDLAYGDGEAIAGNEVSEFMNAVARFEDENGVPLAASDVDDDAWESADEDSREQDAEMVDAPEQPLSSPNPIESMTNDEIETSTKAVGEHTEEPPSYVVLESAVPTTHHFVNEPHTTSPAQMKRVQKDHKILSKPSSLPTGVFVRTWESRLDLLRVLIVGPTETPYTHAPFIVDIFLPAAYPTEPPKVYFHSWLPEATSGTHGRLNPNLYEDGTICLSLLGTWDGAPGESWSPARSTILQVIVSILGLVLVREPYYNEAGYEALVGTEASKVPSTLYSERVFLRSKGLIITALIALMGERRHEAPGIEDTDDILRWLYYSPRGPNLLQTTIDDVASILERSDGSQESNGLTVMSKGACIPLRRVLDRLRQLQTPNNGGAV